jgi:hypothetical protein
MLDSPPLNFPFSLHNRNLISPLNCINHHTKCPLHSSISHGRVQPLTRRPSASSTAAQRVSSPNATPPWGQFLNIASQECFEMRPAINPDDGILTINFRANWTCQLQALRRCRPKNREKFHHPLHWRAGLRLQGLKVPPSHPGLHAPGW